MATARPTHGRDAFVAHSTIDVYGPGKVLGVDGEHRRVRFIHFIGTVRAVDLRPANSKERKELAAWLRRKSERYSTEW
ncbi:hypothetical protein RB200_07945 [Streptomyces sp. PmtG]